MIEIFGVKNGVPRFDFLLIVFGFRVNHVLFEASVDRLPIFSFVVFFQPYISLCFSSLPELVVLDHRGMHFHTIFSTFCLKIAFIRTCEHVPFSKKIRVMLLYFAVKEVLKGRAFFFAMIVRLDIFIID